MQATNTKKPRILLVSRNLPPLVGGMERLNWHMAKELLRYSEIRVVGPTGSAGQAPANIIIAESPLKPLWLFLLSAGLQTLWTALRWRPDFVLAGSGLTAPLALVAARISGAASAAYLHGLDITVPHPVYHRLWLPALRRLDCIIANSAPTAELAKQAGINPDRISVIHPGVTTPTQARNTEDTKKFKNAYGINDRQVLLSVGRLTTRKGLREFVEQCLPKITKQLPDVVLLVIGDAPNESLHAEIQSRHSIQIAADSAGVGKNILFAGAISDSDLISAYHAADVHVFPIRHIPNDPEGFGMVAIEAAAHGLSTVAFALGGVIDAVSDNISGHLIEPGDYNSFAKAVIDILKNSQSMQNTCIEFASRFNWDSFGKAVVEQLKKYNE